MDRYTQNILYSASELVKEKEYWLKKLEGIDEFSTFNANNFRHQGHNITSDRLSYKIPVNIVQRTMSIAKESKYGAFVIFVCGVMVLVKRYTGKNDILFAMPAFKSKKNIKQINSFLPLRFNINEETSFRDSILEVKNTIVEADENKNLSIQMVMESLNFIQETNATPNIIVLEKSIHDEYSIENSGAGIIFSFNIGSNIDLNIEYDTNSYKKSSIDCIANQFIAFLASAVQNPSIKLNQINIMSEIEKNLILEQFNNSTNSYDRKKTIVSLFQKQVGKVPQNIALCFEGECITYFELNKRANRIAWLLKEKNTGIESIVSIAMKRTTNLIAAIIGILKAGCTFLPIDPDFPKERIKFMIEDSKSRLLLTQKDLINHDFFSGEVIELEDSSLYEGNSLNIDIDSSISPKSLGYVLYTSGSTGKPKGVMIELQSITNFINGVSRKIEFKEGKSILAVTTVSFDIFILETLLPLALGMKVFLANEEEQKNPEMLAKLILGNLIDMVQMTPSRLQMLINDEQGLSCLSGLKELMVGGEALPRALFNELKKLQNTKLYNMYGPTETTIWSTIKDLREDDEVNIGKPIDNTYIYIFSSNMELLPIGIAGELYIGGDGVARGYLNLPELTDDKFVSNPFREGERMYRTGDMARWLPDGNIEFLGRADQQVKIRGYRIELEEIENILRKHQLIKEAVVVFSETDDGSRSLVAFLISDSETILVNIRDYLAEELPEYMMPSYFMKVEAMPLTPNGKIDRKKLSAIKPVFLEEQYVAPRNEIEESMVNIWGDVLRNEKIGIRDNFFYVGGDSIKVIQILARMSKLGMKLNVEDFFEYKTIERLSSHVVLNLNGTDINSEYYLSDESDEGQYGISSEEYESLAGMFDSNIEKIYPLSPLQEGILLHSVLHRDSTAYFQQLSFNLKGDFRLEYLEKTIDILIQRYELFRTAFAYNGLTSPRQIVLRNRKAQIAFEDISHMDELQRTQYMEEAKDNDKKREFDLTKEILIRFLVFKTDNDSHVVVFSHHHIIMDGWSTNIIIGEFFEIYNSIKLGISIDLKKISPYSQFIHWLYGQNKDEALKYWEDYLNGYEQQVSLPGYRKGETGQEYVQKEVEFSIGEELTTGLREIARRHQTTTSNIFNTIWGILLGYYNNTQDVTFGAVVSGRPPELNGIESMAGLFINTIPVRIRMDESRLTFTKLLERVQHDAVGSMKNSYFSLAEIQSRTQLKDKLIEHVIIYLNLPEQNAESGSGQESDFWVDSFDMYEQTMYDLSVKVFPGRNLQVKLIYNSSAFDGEQIANLPEHFIRILRQVTCNTNIAVSKINILTDEEIDRNLSFNNSFREYQKEKTIYQLFQEQVKLTPDKTAIEFENEHITYRELNTLANKLARSLREKGVKAGTIVAILMDRKPEFIIGILAVLKAGGAYLPIDSKYPRERIKYILSDSQSFIILTNRDIDSDLGFDREILWINSKELYKTNGSNLSVVNSSSDPACIIYTSGVTGNPKGIVLNHYGITNHAFTKINLLGLDEKSVLSHNLSINFVASIWLALAPIIIGGKVVLYPEGVMENPYKLFKRVDNDGVTVLELIPSFLAGYMDFITSFGDEKLKLENLKKIVLTGEEVRPQVVNSFYTEYENIELFNAYGQSECSDDTLHYRIPFNTRTTKVPIGKPSNNTHVYILNSFGQIQVPGLEGELCISGDGVSKGYLNLPELTNEKFILNPFKPLEIMYRTGDLARWLPDGNVEFLGRIDQQVKIRGYRIELKEVESVLRTHELIEEAIVMAKADYNNDKCLVAYLVCSGDADLANIREYLASRLPDYMIPLYYIKVESIPLTLSGKVDRNALLEMKAVYLTQEYVAPRNEIEEKLVDIWKEVLGLDTVGIRDNFFNVGGDSIKIIQILARMNKLGMVLNFEDVFEYKTIEQLSSHVSLSPKEIMEGYLEGNIPLVPLHSWIINSKVLERGSYAYIIMFCSTGRLDERHIEMVCDKLIEHHDALRISCEIEDGISLYNRGMEANLYNLVTYDIRGVEDYSNEVQKIIKELSTQEEVLRVVQVNLLKTDECDYLLFGVNSLVVDRVSCEILYEDISTLYKQIINNEEMSLGPKTGSFKEWSERVQAYTKDDELYREIEYWENIEALDTVRLPKDELFNEYQHEENETYQLLLPKEETEKLLNDVNRAYNTKGEDILLAALGLTIKNNLNIDKMVIDIISNAREGAVENLDVSRTVGCFESIHPFLLDISVSNSISDQIKSVKESNRRLPKRGIGYNILKNIVDNEGRKSIETNRIADISFSYLGEFGGDEDLLKYDGLSSQYICSIPGMFLERSHVLDIIFMVINKKLTINIVYNRKDYNETMMAIMVESFKSNLYTVINHCMNRKVVEATPSDYGEYEMSIYEFGSILKKYDGRIEKIYPLSPSQEGILLHSIAHKSSNAYFQQLSFVLNGEFDSELLERSYNRLLDRYELFRTVFVYSQVKNPRQIVLKHRNSNIFFNDISDMDESQRIEHVEKWKEADKRNGFDLTSDILMRISVFKTSENSFIVVWSFHHVIMDGWSTNIIIDEFLNIYNSLKGNKQVEAGVVYPYSNFIEWLQRQNKTKALEYWEDYFNGYEQQVSLPRINNYINAKKDIQKEFTFSFGMDLTKEFIAISRMHQVTISNLFNAVWAILLASYNNTRDVAFGIVVSGRPPELAGVEQMVGLFINTIPVRVRMTDDALTFKSLLECIQNESITNIRNSYFPLAEIQSRTELKEKLIDHIIIHLNLPEKEASEQEVRDVDFSVDGFEMYEQTMYDLNVKVIQDKDLTVKLVYNPTVYNEELMRNLPEHFKNIIKQIVWNVDIPVNRIDILTDDERRQMLSEFNDTYVDCNITKTINELFQEQVKRSPDKIALVIEGKQKTYRELNIMSNKLARSLREKGVTGGTIVGVLLERSYELVVAILAILKAGAGYLPLDSKYPHERIEYMLQDSKAHILLTNTVLYSEFKFDREILDINDEQLYIPHGSNLKSENSFFHPACIIYTSGTTGNPKGVVLNHKGIINHAYTKIKVLGINDQSILSHNLSINFVASIWLVFAPLFTGAKLIMYPEKLIQNSYMLLKRINDDNVTILELIPSFMAGYLDFIRSRSDSKLDLLNLKKIVLTGEEVKAQIVNNFFSEYRDIELYNAYGQSECSDDTLHYKIPYNLETAIVPIGKPSNNTYVYILNKFGQLQVPWMEGELYIGGAGLATGYLDKPELTDEKFIPNPFKHGERMYRTGDMAKWSQDGNVEFLGRLDHEVKIRGYRIELGEIEEQLTKIQGINEAVVVPVENDDNKYLCAYIVSDIELKNSQIKATLSRKLPFYMIPLEYIRIAKIPLNNNGKLDYKSLPSAKICENDEDDNLSTLEIDSIEYKLIGILMDTLKIVVPSSGAILDSLLESLGINSMTFIKMIVTIESTFGIEFEDNELDYTKYPNLSSLAEYVRKRQNVDEKGVLN